MDKDQTVYENLGKSIKDLVQECRGHFDSKLASRICRERSFPQSDKTEGVETLDAFLNLFRHDSSRQEFLAFYVPELQSEIAGKANCGCVYHADEGTPCEHDLALLGPPIYL
jgi:hypothetical protein